MANLDVPGWKKALHFQDWETLNKIIIKDCEGAARGLERAWGRGGPKGTKEVTVWDGWFENLYCRIHDLSLDGRLSRQAEGTALSACAQILALERVPHWDHVDNIAALRSLLRPNQAWDDYPKNTGADEDDDDMM